MGIINIKDDIRIADFTFPETNLYYTNHAAERLTEKGLPMLQTLTIEKGMIVEVEPEIQKVVVRLSGILPDQFDLVLVTRLTKFGWLCITAWKNHINDTHETYNQKPIRERS